LILEGIKRQLTLGNMKESLDEVAQNAVEVLGSK
jgi:hypothetical protein